MLLATICRCGISTCEEAASRVDAPIAGAGRPTWAGFRSFAAECQQSLLDGEGETHWMLAILRAGCNLNSSSVMPTPSSQSRISFCKRR